MDQSRYFRLLLITLLAISGSYTTAVLAAYTPGYIYTVAGTGVAGYSGDGGPATSAQLNLPQGAIKDGAGNLYIADYNNNRIRKVDASTGIITTVAGNGTKGYSGDNVPATSAMLNWPSSVDVDGVGNLYIADGSNCRVRKVDASTGIITTVAGNGTCGYSGDGGPATSSMLNFLCGAELDGAGNLYISDCANQRVRKVAASTGIITTVQSYATGFSLDSAGNLYIGYGNIVSKVDASTGIITRVAGNGIEGYSGDGGPATSAMLGGNIAIPDGAGNLYIGDGKNCRVRKVTASTGIITTVVGNGTCGYSGDNGPAASSKLNTWAGPQSMDSAGNMYIADVSNSVIRMVAVVAAAGEASTVSQSDCLFNWAERNYAQYFSPAGAASATYTSYFYRYYSGTGNYLAISSADNHIWVLGHSFGNNPVDVGPVSSFLGVSGCQ